MVLSLSTVSHAQKIALKSGSVASLGTLSEVRVEYTYDNMMVGKYKEADYLKKKVEEYNKKEPGKGDQWQQDWVNDRGAKFQPRFQDAFNNFCNILAVNFKIDPNAGGKYRMVVHTTFTEPGFNIYMTSKNASINAEVTFFDESNAEMAKVTITNSPGSGIFDLDYDTGTRIQEAYANAGRSLAAFILEEAFGKK
ncbi:MAG: hypothetical protein M0Q51_04360 [Bacteroidales bacterium]|nr:hypothetical protein [Bacteroidales bacterium]